MATMPAIHMAMLTDLKPMGDRIIVKRDPAKTETASGLALPDTSKEKQFWGTVAAVGPDVNPERLDVGDRVLFGFHSGTDLPETAGKDLVIMRQAEVWAKL